ncbi:MAG: hypothetical protein WBF53_08230 [Litorimonas sp.]
MAKRRSFNLTGKIYAVLSASPEERHTARDIAKQILHMFPEDCAAKKARAKVDFTDYTLEDQLVAEIGSQRLSLLKRHDDVRTVETRPREFYVTASTEQDEAEAPTLHVSLANSAQKALTEHDLYPKLGEYLWSESDCYAMRIDERRSKNNRGQKGNMWLYPDVVGMTSLSQDWSRNTVDLAKETRAELAQLFSFEVKLTINRANVREVFFQTLSNSSWAHQSYLVASEINSKAVPELRMLCASHGIGLIQLDADDPANSQTLIPAQPKPSVDWNLLDRLAVENTDARKFVKAVWDFYRTGDTSVRAWDLTPEEDAD